MKLYSFFGAPNPRKVLVYLGEKGLKVPTQEVNIISGENRTPEFLAKNPLGGLPVLELDDGSHLTESLAIIEYLEETQPNPSLLGGSALERARTREAERIADLGVLGRVAVIFQNTHPFMAGRIKQSPDAADTARGLLANSLRTLNARIGKNPFVTGAKPTIADCTLFAALEFAAFAQVAIDPEYDNVLRWYEAFKQRPSAQLPA